MPIPRMIAATPVSERSINKLPPEISITDCVNFNPSPDTKTEPMIKPAHAQAMETATVARMPLSRAANMSTGLRRVSARMKLSPISATIPKKAARIGV